MTKFQLRFLIQRLKSLPIGMMKRMEYGNQQRYQIQHLKDHGNARKSRTQTTRGNGKFHGLITQSLKMTLTSMC
nr:hypothetical protein C5167_031114 [Ipomoea batatas]